MRVDTPEVMNKLLHFTNIILFSLITIFPSSFLAANWPLPTILQMRFNSLTYMAAYRRRDTLNEMEESSMSTTTTNLGFFDNFCRQVLGQSVPFQNSLDFSMTSIGSILDNEFQKTCEICFGVVEMEECPQCCINGHRIHFDCFKAILGSSDIALHKCPLCRDPFLSKPSDVFDEIIESDPGVDPVKWPILESHYRAFLDLKPLQMAQINWPHALFHVITKGSPFLLEHLLRLPNIDINFSFKNGECAISILMHGIQIYHEQQHVEPIKTKLNIVLNHPNIRLDRMNGILPRHLIYEAVDLNNFQIFLMILEASSSSSLLDISELFRYICYKDDKEIFFNYLLTCESFDLFETDEFNNSALHIVTKRCKFNWTLSLLQTPQCTTEHLMKADARTGSTVLHLAMVNCTHEVIVKLFSFPGIDWDLMDYFGQSIRNLYENRYFH